MSDYRRVPVYINCRDRVRDLRGLVAWLENAGHERITLLDNASTFEPLLDYLRATPHDVMCLGYNLGSRALWNADLAPNEAFVYTDPDIRPVDACPPNAVEYLAELLDRHPSFPKAALGLYLDDVPDTMDSLDWERSLVGIPSAQFPKPRGVELEPGAFDSLADTTFALYRPGATYGLLALRTGAPYQARHTPWYVTEPDEEDAYYLQRAIKGPEGSSWADGKNRSWN